MTVPSGLEHWRTVDAPFTQGDWQPAPGTCSRCSGKAWRGQTRWWHHDQPCPSRGRPAHFQADTAGGDP